MEPVLALIVKAHQGDKKARETVFEENVGLVWSIVRRFINRGVDPEDLFQIGSIGLLKAIDNFNLAYGVKFSTYAVPVISGEIRRFLRDDGLLKVSRTMKETAARAYAVRESMEKQTGREPAMDEISRELGISLEDLALAMDASADVESLQKSVYQGEGGDMALEERIPGSRDEQEQILDRIFLEEMLGHLGSEERRLIYMRYFQEMTQSKIAGILGVSQVQVSRMERRIMDKMRGKMRD